jgi:motility quorum-sensing regulator / GCU-specific mRNA interferase toxin
MEKRTPHYKLYDIQAQMTTVESLHLTRTARNGIRDAEMLVSEALAVVQMLTQQCLHKSMTTHADHRVWQDVYYTQWKDKPLYVKFQRNANGYFTISFKERS